MIQKWYCFVCDKCGEVCNYWETTSIEKAIKREKKDGGAKITKRANGTYYIECVDCRKEQK